MTDSPNLDIQRVPDENSSGYMYLNENRHNKTIWVSNDYSDDFRFNILLVYLFISLLGTVGNTLVIVINIRFSKIRRKSVSNYYIINLAAADQLFLLTLPLFAYFTYVKDWIFGDILCRLTFLFRECNKFASVFTLMALSIDRYLASYPHLGHWRSIEAGIFVCLGIWTVCLSGCTPYLIYSSVMTPPSSTENIRSCRFQWGSFEMSRAAFTYAQIIIGFVIPLLIIATFNTLLLIRLTRLKRPGQVPHSYLRLASQMLHPERRSFVSSVILRRGQPRSTSLDEGEIHGVGSPTSGAAASLAITRRHMRMMRQLTVMVVVFTVCHLPYHMVEVLSLRTEENYNKSGVRPSSQHVDAFVYMNIVVQMLVFISSCCNPIIYGICNRNFRDLYRQVLCCCCTASAATLQRIKTYCTSSRSTELTGDVNTDGAVKSMNSIELEATA